MSLLQNFIPTLYARITPDRLTLRSSKTKAVWDDEAMVAITAKDKPKVIAIGTAARMAVAQSPGITLHHPFGHPRCLVSDFMTASALLKQAMREFVPHGLFSPAPRLIVHPCPSVAQSTGRMTAIEVRALRDLGLSSGASSVYLLHSPDLAPVAPSEEEILSLLQLGPQLERLLPIARRSQ